MAKAISLKLDDDLFEDLTKLTKSLGTSRNRYINEAIEAYNRKMKREELAEIFKKEVPLIRASTMEVLREFEALEDDYEAI